MGRCSIISRISTRLRALPLNTTFEGASLKVLGTILRGNIRTQGLVIEVDLGWTRRKGWGIYSFWWQHGQRYYLSVFSHWSWFPWSFIQLLEHECLVETILFCCFFHRRIQCWIQLTHVLNQFKTTTLFGQLCSIGPISVRFDKAGWIDSIWPSKADCTGFSPVWFVEANQIDSFWSDDAYQTALVCFGWLRHPRSVCTDSKGSSLTGSVSK